jgi:hypothetical protein
MPEALIIDDEQAQELDEVGFQRATPQRNETAQEEIDKHLPRYGCSPAFDIDVRDRYVLPAEQEQTIHACSLVQFIDLPLRTAAEDGDAAAPAYEPNAFDRPQGLGSSPRFVRKTKFARDCAMEMLFAYGDTNPWGFRVFSALTGLEPDEAYATFKQVLPRKMNLAQMIAHLESLEIDESFFRDADAMSVRDQLLAGCREAEAFAIEVREGSADEVAKAKSGGNGKSRFDKRDQKVSQALGLPLPEVSPVPVIQMPTQQGGVDAETLRLMLQQAEENGRLKATLAEREQAKQPKARAVKSEQPSA